METHPEIPPPPPLRQGFASRAEVRQQLLEWPGFLPPLYGDLHTHTDWSDGKSSLLEMAQAAEERGYSYLAVTDHAAKLKIAGGLSLAKLHEQGGEIDALNQTLKAQGYRVRLLRSSELNFAPNGEVDYELETLRELDFTIGAFHSKLRLTDDQTERYLRAVENPGVDVLAHPICRIFNYRRGLSADWRRVMERVAQLGKAVEVDGIPDRQDMGPGLLSVAAEFGVYVSLGSDSHSDQQLRNIDFALAAVLKAGIAPERVLNFMSLEELREWRERRLQASGCSTLAKRR